MWLHRAKSIGVRSGDLGGQTIGPPVQPSYRFKWRRDVDSEEDLISFIIEAAAIIGQQPSIFERTRHHLLCRRLCIEVGGRTFEHLF